MVAPVSGGSERYFPGTRHGSAFLGTATTKVYGNLGKVRNRGLDLSMDYTHQIGKDFFISAKGTFTFARNRVLEQDEPDYLQYPNLSRVGRSVNSFLLYEAQRLFIDDNEVKYSPEQLLAVSHGR